MIIVSLLVLALLALALVFWVWAHRQVSCVHRHEPFLRNSDPTQLPDTPPRLTVVIPAHNEESNLPRALDALLAQDYPAFEVVVASDRSTDGTVAIVREYAARDGRVRLYENTETPEGWAGKPWVLHRVAEQVETELLLFVDADIALDPRALTVMVDHFLRGGLDLLSLYFRHEGSSALEEIVHILIGVVVQLRYRIKNVNDPSSPVAMANGQDLMVRTKLYREVGQHEAFKGRVQEDLLLARALKSRGRRIETGYGFEMGAARWYPSFGAMWHGWMRNVYGLAEGRLTTLFSGIALIFDIVLAPCAGLIVAGCVAASGGTSPWTTAILAGSLVDIVLAMWLFARLLRISRGRLRSLWLLPWACVIFGAILTTNVFCRLTGRGLVWRGKRYHSCSDGLHARNP